MKFLAPPRRSGARKAPRLGTNTRMQPATTPGATAGSTTRRTSGPMNAREPLDGNRIRFERWTLDVDQRELIGEDGVATPLSTAEFRLLSAFLSHPRMVLSREQLLDLTSGRAAQAFDRSIDNQVSRLRRKIEADPKNPSLIKTVWGGGYRLAAEVRKS